MSLSNAPVGLDEHHVGRNELVNLPVFPIRDLQIVFRHLRGPRDDRQTSGRCCPVLTGLWPAEAFGEGRQISRFLAYLLSTCGKIGPDRMLGGVDPRPVSRIHR
ncbi:hypothetical protein VUR80DRAFT_6248 [Thermomyces stellatus]